MAKTKHQGQHPVLCPACITLAEKKRMPWHKDYIDVLVRAGDDIKKKHEAAIRRQTQS